MYPRPRRVPKRVVQAPPALVEGWVPQVLSPQDKSQGIEVFVSVLISYERQNVQNTDKKGHAQELIALDLKKILDRRADRPDRHNVPHKKQPLPGQPMP